jgi:hypothetical protein
VTSLLSTRQMPEPPVARSARTALKRRVADGSRPTPCGTWGSGARGVRPRGIEFDDGAREEAEPSVERLRHRRRSDAEMSQPHLTCPGNELVHERLSDAGVPMLGEDKDIADVSPRPSAQPACYRHAVVALDVRHADGCTTHLDQKERSGPALGRPPLTKRGVEAGVVNGAADALFVPGATEIGQHTNVAIARDSGRDAHSSLVLYSVEGGHPREEIIARASLNAGTVTPFGSTPFGSALPNLALGGRIWLLGVKGAGRAGAAARRRQSPYLQSVRATTAWRTASAARRARSFVPASSAGSNGSWTCGTASPFS